MSIYKPYEDREPDSQYRALLEHILKNGKREKTQQETDALTVIGTQSHFDLANGFPMITERSIKGFWKQAVGELLGFVNGARTQKQLEEFGCSWWEPWVTPAKTTKRGLGPGDIGPGSYGAAFHDFPTADGGTFNQFRHLVEQIKELPHLRTHFITPWIPQYIVRGRGKQQKVTVAPCHGWVHVRILDGELTLHMFQRSGDVPVGVPANMTQYAALTLALAEVTGYPAREFVHTISDAHIYVDQIEHVEEMLNREPKPLPTVVVVNPKQDIFAYRKDDFELSDYDPHPAIKEIPVAI